MKMKALLFSLALMLSFFLGSSVSKAADCFDGGSCTLDELMGGDTISNGGLLFDNFGSYSVNSSGIAAVTPDQILVTAVNINGEYGLKFQKAILAINSQFIDISFDFRVTCESGEACLTGNTLILNGNAVGLGGTGVIETVFNAADPNDSVSKFALVVPSFSVYQPVDQQPFPNSPWLSAIVLKDIFVYGNFAGGPCTQLACGIGTMSDFVQTFGQSGGSTSSSGGSTSSSGGSTSSSGGNSSGGSTGGSSGQQIPEPSTLLLLGTGLVGMAAWGRRRLRKDA